MEDQKEFEKLPTEPRNLTFWNRVKRPPIEALSQITGGRLKGMTDIDPVWRLQILTENFGICGHGWVYKIVKSWREEGSDNQAFVFIMLELIINGFEPIPAIGSAMLTESQQRGLYHNKEAYKMALTDALGVACKALGIGADVYMGQFDGSKYKTPDTPVIEQGAESKITIEQGAEINDLCDVLYKSKKIKDTDDFETRLNRLYGKKDISLFTEQEAKTLIEKLKAL